MGSVVDFTGTKVLEVGCGTGVRSVQIAQKCAHLAAVEPDATLLAQARGINDAENITYLPGSAEALPFDDGSFDIVFFTLSFHHVPEAGMSKAIDEAARVVRRDGHIIFFEPAFQGSFFESEIAFDACDGDERKRKAAAYACMLGHRRLREIAELHDETIFSFESATDFIESMSPKKGAEEEWETFLRLRHFTLDAQRRINIFKSMPLK
ncbi:class I SAM-dependent methyltransferase [Candidatus Uhrbacteria bacterium]|nr:class I SAM-dependent methyltransferase [Candidatus Uhrbacteria bacterium]